MLEAFGHHPGLRLVLFTVDEDTFSRELAPIAGVYPACGSGAPWWFLDTPDGMRRFREAVTDTAGFANTTGFVDDTRAFCSIPARHDLARRIDAGFLARLVAEHRLDLDEAVDTAVDLAYRIPRGAYAPPKFGKRFPAHQQRARARCEGAQVSDILQRLAAHRLVPVVVIDDAAHADAARRRPWSTAGCPSPRSPSAPPPRPTRSAPSPRAATCSSAPAPC